MWKCLADCSVGSASTQDDRIGLCLKYGPHLPCELLRYIFGMLMRIVKIFAIVI